MRKFEDGKLLEVICNKCGKNILVENGIAKQGVQCIEISWDYFSNKDGEKHIFDLCENCCDEIAESFVIKIERKDNTELI